MGGEKREYTPEQHAVVKRVRACKVTAYYEILEVKKECNEGDIKKAYRKVCACLATIWAPTNGYGQLALALHPDKNGAPGADEAFKRMWLSTPILSLTDHWGLVVSKAFQILSGWFLSITHTGDF
jgi:DnaJ family protein B protein 12